MYPFEIPCRLTPDTRFPRQGQARSPLSQPSCGPGQRYKSEIAEGCVRSDEVREEHGMTPMHHSRKDDPIDISQNFLEWLALLGWLCGQCGTDCARFAIGRN